MSAPGTGSDRRRSRDHDEFLRLFLTRQADLKAYIVGVVRDFEWAEDVFQEVALVLWERFGDYDPARSFGAWARGIATNKILQSRRTRRRAPPPLSSAALEALANAFGDDEFAEAQERERLDALRSCLGHLPDPSRRLLRLRYEKGLSLESVAGQLKRTLTAVTKALSRLRVALGDCVRHTVDQDAGVFD